MGSASTAQLHVTCIPGTAGVLVCPPGDRRCACRTCGERPRAWTRAVSGRGGGLESRRALGKVVMGAKGG